MKWIALIQIKKFKIKKHFNLKCFFILNDYFLIDNFSKISACLAGLIDFK
jgi:hypothetical protein